MTAEEAALTPVWFVGGIVSCVVVYFIVVLVRDWKKGKP